MMMTTRTDTGWPTTMPLTVRHSQVVTSHDTEHSLHESVTCRKTAQISSSHRCGYAVQRQDPSMRELECVKRSGRYLVGNRVVIWRPTRMVIGRGDRATRRSVSAGATMRGDHCLKVWTKKQQVVALSSAESELYVAVKTASKGLGIQSVAKDLGISCRLNLHLDASATMCLVNRRGLGKTKHVDMQNLWIQEASKSGRFTTKKVDTSVSPAYLMMNPVPKARID